mgnify:CR=1 FL=1
MPKRKKHSGVHYDRSTARRGAKNRSTDLDFDEIDSGDSDDEQLLSNDRTQRDDTPEETADEKRVRIAKEYLELLAQKQSEEDQNGDDFFNGGIVGGEDDAVNQQLVQDALDRAGKTFVELADRLWTEQLQPDCRAFRVSHS